MMSLSSASDSSCRYRILLLDYSFVRHYTIAQETISLLGRRVWETLLGEG
jgi:hypothetical protein